MKLFAAAAFTALLAAGTVACDRMDVNLTFTPNSLSFTDTSWESQTVQVTMTGEDAMDWDWEVAATPEWVNAVRDGDILTVTVQDYSAYRDRTGDIVIKVSRKKWYIPVTQSGSNPSFRILETNGIPASAVSPNGRYIVGGRSSSSFIYDRSTDKLTLVGGSGPVADPNDISKGLVMLYDVSDTGLAVGWAAAYDETTTDPDDVDLLPISYNVNTKDFTWLQLTGDGIRTDVSTGNAWSVSADGSAISGFLQYPADMDSNDIEFSYLPVVWQNNVPVVLGHNPEGLGDGDKTNGYMPTSISADGTIAAGYLSTRFSDHVGCWWDMSNPSEINFFLQDDPKFYSTYLNTIVDKTLPNKYPRTEKLSLDGKTITASIVDMSVAGTTSYTPFNYNIETGETIVAQDNNAIGSFTIPSGELVYASVQSTGSAYDSFFYKDGQTSSMHDWLLDVHNTESPEDERMALRDASQSGKVMVGFLISTGGIYETIVVSL